MTRDELWQRLLEAERESGVPMEIVAGSLLFYVIGAVVIFMWWVCG